MRRLMALVLVSIVTLAGVGGERACTPQERLAGRPKLIDGDSFELGNVGVRLFGVDAPEGRQSCTRDGRDWSCGDSAAAELRRLVGSRDVACEQRDKDTYGRIVAVCRVGTTDLGEAMVRAGMATAYRRYSNDYVDEENEARRARRGIWAGEFTPPETYRNEQRDTPRERAAAPPPQSQRDGCYIKGNINGDGERIYHTPGSSSYADTAIDESKGERWFCTEGEARTAGWRAPRQPKGGSR
ncbi:MAG TPA: thermonuclease family protein [Gammaproteobacteria bacterium]|nr:thermonuclease family protein [Gammaproteobacteria bacterium]